MSRLLTSDDSVTMMDAYIEAKASLPIIEAKRASPPVQANVPDKIRYYYEK